MQKLVLCLLIGLAIIGAITLSERVSQLPFIFAVLRSPGEWFLRNVLRGIVGSPSTGAMVAFWCNVVVYATIAYLFISATERPRYR